MITDTEMLNYIRQTTAMGHDSIDAIMKYASCKPLKQALQQQKAEYGELYLAATDMLKKRGAQPDPQPMSARMAVSMSKAMHTFSPPSTSKIAEEMISGNTKGVIKSLQHNRKYIGKDERITDLSKKLLETEQNNIEQMKPFL